MKKFIAIAALALCATAQAVTYTWDSYGTSSTVPGANEWRGNANHTTLSISFGAISGVAVSTMPTSGKIALQTIQVSNRNNNNVTPAYVEIWDGNTKVATTTSVTNSGNRVIYTVNDGYYTRGSLTYTFADIELDVTKTYTLKAFNADGAAVDFTTSNVSAEDPGTFYAAMAITAQDVPNIPEPTVLALLALGVAGVALKRKVA